MALGMTGLKLDVLTENNIGSGFPLADELFTLVVADAGRALVGELLSFVAGCVGALLLVVRFDLCSHFAFSVNSYAKFYVPHHAIGR